MKLQTFYLLVLLIFSCKGSSKKGLEQIEFDQFSSKFAKVTLPFSISCEDEFIRRIIYDSVTAEHKPNIYSSIDRQYYKYLNDKSVGNQNIDYRSAFKLIEEKNFIGVLFIKDSLTSEGETDQSWLILNTYTTKGEFINQLKIAGWIFAVNTQFCKIDKNLKIKTTAYFLLPDVPKIDALHAKKVVKEYSITDKGEILNFSAKDSLGFFNVSRKGGYTPFSPASVDVHVRD